MDVNAAKEKLKKNGKIVGEFKEFISRGNVMDMAVGIIVGSSFTGIINSFVNDIIMPIIGFLFGGINFTDFKYPLAPAKGDIAAVTLNYGMFAQKIIDFLLIALVVFLMVRIMNRFRRKKDEPKPEVPQKPVLSQEAKLLTEIRDSLINK